MIHSQNDLGFNPNAPNDTAAILYRMARAGRGTVLHLGSGADGVARALSTLEDMKVSRVMSNRYALQSETTEGLEAFVAHPEVTGWYSVLNGRTYDVVIVADLVEQLRDPERFLRDLREQRLLAEDGRLLISFANLGNEAVANELLSGDSTRLHWYTLGSMSRLLEACGYLVVETHRTHRPVAGRPITSGTDEAQTYEYVVQAHPSAAVTQLVLLHRQLDDTTQRLAEAQADRDQMRALLEEERAAFRHEIRRGADELAQLQNNIAQISDERSALRDETRRLHDQLARQHDQLEGLRDEVAGASTAKQTADRRLATIQQSRSYRWSRGVARAANVAVAPFRSGRRRLRRGR